MRLIRRAVLAILTHVISCLFLGTLGALLLLVQALRGKFRVVGYWRYVWAVWRGRLIIAESHSTVFNSMITLFLLVPWAWVFPWMFPYSFTADDAFKGFIKYINKSIWVVRDKEKGVKAKPASGIAMEQLRRDRVLKTAPEAACTDTDFKSHEPKPQQRYLFNRDRSRKLRNFIDLPRSNTTVLAQETHSRIIVIYIDVPVSGTKWIKETMVEWLRSGEVITVYVSEPYYPDSEWTQAEGNADMAERMLTA